MAASGGAGSILYLSFLYAALTGVATVGLGLLVDWGRWHVGEVGAGSRFRWDIIAALAGGVLCGAAVGGVPAGAVASLVNLEVALLLFLVGLTCCSGSSWGSLRAGFGLAGRSIAVSLAAGVATGAAGSLLTGVRLGVSLMYTLGMGWYSFAGPYAAVAAGGSVGLSVFLANLVREQAVYVAVPLLRRPLVGLLALGGATSMDNTLPVYVAVYREEVAPAAVLQGVVLTLIVPALLGAVSAL